MAMRPKTVAALLENVDVRKVIRPEVIQQLADLNESGKVGDTLAASIRERWLNYERHSRAERDCAKRSDA
jgi:hypothetical protein